MNKIIMTFKFFIILLQFTAGETVDQKLMSIGISAARKRIEAPEFELEDLKGNK